MLLLCIAFRASWRGLVGYVLLCVERGSRGGRKRGGRKRGGRKRGGRKRGGGEGIQEVGRASLGDRGGRRGICMRRKEFGVSEGEKSVRKGR